jgi:hypothetical protein
MPLAPINPIKSMLARENRKDNWAVLAVAFVNKFVVGCFLCLYTSLQPDFKFFQSYCQ